MNMTEPAIYNLVSEYAGVAELSKLAPTRKILFLNAVVKKSRLQILWYEITPTLLGYHNAIAKGLKFGEPPLVPLNSDALATSGTCDKMQPMMNPSSILLEQDGAGRQMLFCFAAAVQRVGIEDFHYHDLRHTFAIRLRAAGVPEYDIADLVGRSPTPGSARNTRVTRGYAHGALQGCAKPLKISAL